MHEKEQQGEQTEQCDELEISPEQVSLSLENQTMRTTVRESNLTLD